MNNQNVIVYADLNCPFCFALHERLITNNFINDVEWRSMEHAPNIKFDINDYLVQSELSEEVTKVRALADEITIIVPRARPNTNAATKLIAEVEKTDPQKAIKLRTLCYRELWINGNDISDPTILNGIAYLADAEVKEISKETIEQLKIWQQEWEEGDFSRNTPVVISKDGNKLLGLPAVSVLKAFFQGDTEQTSDFYDGVCVLKSKESVLISTASKLLYTRISGTLDSNFVTQQVASKSELIDVCVSGQKFDLIIVAESFGEDSCLDLVRPIRNISSLRNIPVILISLSADPRMEIKAFELGANDFVITPYTDEALLARIRLQLRVKRTIDLLEQHARMDSLTEIPNRREYNHVIEREWRQAIRTKTPLSMILIDVDYFKLYNDHYGHMQGDECLKNVARLVDDCKRRPYDVAARYGGEEFVIILPQTDVDGALIVANKIRETLASQNIENNSSPLKYLTLSQGVASIEPTATSHLNDFVKSVDDALYEAKDAGRDQIKSVSV